MTQIKLLTKNRFFKQGPHHLKKKYNSSPKILLITSYFPPEKSVASNRTYAFAKYLSRLGFEIYVLTDQKTKSDKYTQEKIFLFNSNSFFNIFKFYRGENLFKHYLKALYNTLHAKIFIDTKFGFFHKGFPVAKRLVKEHDIQIVLTSYAPYSCLRLGIEIKKHFPNIVWVSDLRDEIISPLVQSKFKLRRLQKLEKEVTKYANLITTVSNPIAEDIKERAKTNIKIAEINNGFDFEPIKELKEKSKLFSIVYLGTVYGGANPKNFFHALELIKKRRTDFSFEVKFYSDIQNFLIPAFIKANVQTLNKVLYEDIPSILKQSDALLLIQAKSPRKGVYTGKLFDYLAADRPILAIVDTSDCAAQLIAECNAGYIASDDQIEEIVFIIEQAYNNWQNNSVLSRRWDIVEKYSRLNQVKKLKHELDSIL